MLLTFQLPVAQPAQSANHNPPWQRGHLDEADAPFPQFLQPHFPGRNFRPACSAMTTQPKLVKCDEK